MMMGLYRWAIAGLALVAVAGHAACSWPAWDNFKKDYISDEGRVIDPSDPRKITTSEGQSYGLFFALAANDRSGFDQLLSWTENNLASGALQKQLPAWLWGQQGENDWTVLDTNPASDADIWIAWSLLEAGRLWHEPRYSDTGKALLKLIAQQETAQVPGLGTMLMPGKAGFADKTRWRFNPSYLPPQVGRYLARFGKPWPQIQQTNLQLLLETAPQGFAPDWVSRDAEKGWLLKPEKPLVGSYDAIRVYLWIGMMSDEDPQKAQLMKRYWPMAEITQKTGYPPERVDIARGSTRNHGPVGFSAALLPFLPDRDARALQRQRVADNYPQADAYYSAVLTLFGQGWDQHRFRFSADGELLPGWGEECTGSA